ncbi:hypothetical protein BHE74_00030359 [Ensete ventricosum]|nr:hypothetical protein BHE74_00030359 [Ensete ventricosum]
MERQTVTLMHGLHHLVVGLVSIRFSLASLVATFAYSALSSDLLGSLKRIPHMLMTKAFILCKLRCAHTEDPPLRYHSIHPLNPQPFLSLHCSSKWSSQQLLIIHMITSPSMGLTGTCTLTSSSVVYSPHMLMTKPMTAAEDFGIVQEVGAQERLGPTGMPARRTPRSVVGCLVGVGEVGIYYQTPEMEEAVASESAG